MKGVVCKVAKPEEMPVDKNGKRADLVTDGNSTINRMNIGRLYEHYFNAVSDTIVQEIRLATGIREGDKHASDKMLNIYTTNRPVFDQLYAKLMDYYAILSPSMAKWYLSCDETTKVEHLAYCAKKFIYLYLPTDNPVSYSDAQILLEKKFKPLKDKVTYFYEGKLIESTEDIMIASMYIMLLEKTGDDWSAVASAKLQAFGIIAQISRSDKFTSPIRGQAVRGMAEADTRNAVSYMDAELTAEHYDRNNNPETHEMVVAAILSSDKPTDIERLIDRNKHKFNGAKPIQIVRHIAQCAGWRFKYQPDETYM